MGDSPNAVSPNPKAPRPADTRVLVTGGSGFIGSHAILQLLSQGYQVRTTVRNLAREPGVRAMMTAAGLKNTDALSFVQADLEQDAGWPEAVAGCDYVMHMASPFPLSEPKNEDELIVPARDGALRALRAARDAGVKRVVLTSSFAAIGYGHSLQHAPFDETDWTNLNESTPAYAKSKTLAERAAWDYIAAEGGTLELSVINPVVVFGPVLGPDYASSILLVKRMLDGSLPGYPRLYFGVVDVRDVVDLHLRAMTSEPAKGERFLAAAGESMSLLEMAYVLKARLGERARRVPTRQLPDWVIRLTAVASPTARLAVAELGKMKAINSSKARRILGWTPRSNEEAITATGESLVRFGLLKHGRSPR